MVHVWVVHLKQFRTGNAGIKKEQEIRPVEKKHLPLNPQHHALRQHTNTDLNKYHNRYALGTLFSHLDKDANVINLQLIDQIQI